MPIFSVPLINQQFIIKTIVIDSKNTSENELKEYLKSDNITGHNRSIADALFDTGATKSCITEKLAEKLNLIPISKTIITGASGKKNSDIFIVYLCIPVYRDNKKHYEVIETDVLSCFSTIGEENNFDVILGMDILKNMIFQYTPTQLTIGF